MNIVIDTARDYQAVLPGTALYSQLFNGMVALGEGDQDNSAVIRMLELLNDTDLKTTE